MSEVQNMFAVRNGTGSIVIDGFATKDDAKKKRDALDEYSPTPPMPPIQRQWFVTLGPDHKDYAG